MKLKLIAAKLKAFQSKEWHFPFWTFLFFVLEIFTCLYYANEERDEVRCFH